MVDATVNRTIALAAASIVVCAAAWAAGCAVGAQNDGDPLAQGSGSEGDAGRDAYVAPRYDAGEVEDTGGGTGGGGADAGVDAAPAADASDDSGTACATSIGCQTATSIGTISGDTNGPSATSTGDTETWLQLNVTENDNSIFAVPMKLKVVLDSPPGENFDLYVFMGTAPGQVQCSNVTGQSTNPAGQPQEVDLEWGETGTFANGIDDSEVASIQIKSASGTCQTGANWTLTATGHGQ
jgi:hypothetical protein